MRTRGWGQSQQLTSSRNGPHQVLLAQDRTGAFFDAMLDWPPKVEPDYLRRAQVCQFGLVARQGLRFRV